MRLNILHWIFWVVTPGYCWCGKIPTFRRNSLHPSSGS